MLRAYVNARAAILPVMTVFVGAKHLNCQNASPLRVPRAINIAPPGRANRVAEDVSAVVFDADLDDEPRVVA